VIRTRLTELLGIAHPVVSAPTTAAGGRQAAAVTAAGGLGLVGGSYGDAAFIAAQVPLAAAGGGVWGVGCVMFTFDQRPGLWEQVLDFTPPVLALSFGDEEQTRRYVGRARQVTDQVVVQVHDPEQALVALRAGATVLVAQGAEAGGHHKVRGTLPLIPAVVDVVAGAVPVVAAGGIADGRGLAAALALGADGVMLGTRFVATEESVASPGFKRTLLEVTAADTADTRVFDVVRGIDWNPAYRGRAVANEFHRTWNGREDDLRHRRTEVEARWLEAVERDDVDQRAMFAGEVVDLVRDIRSAGDVVTDLVTEAEDVLGRLTAGVRDLEVTGR
jgi:nitronate monooxygenase